MFVRFSEATGPDSEQVERDGITPDVEVVAMESDVECGDLQLGAALKALGAYRQRYSFSGGITMTTTHP